MPPVFKFYLSHVAIGFAVAAVFVAAILWLNVGNLWHLISGSDVGVLALFMFWFFNGIVFSGVQTAVAIMLMAEKDSDDPGDDDDDDDRGGPGGGTPVPVTIRH